MAATRHPRTMSVDSGNQRQQPTTNANNANSTSSSDSNTGTPTPVDPFSIASLGKMDRNKITFLNLYYSDGKAEIPSATGFGMIPNRPPAEMIKKPNEDVRDSLAYYKPCLPNSKNDVQWRIELGTHLVAQMAPGKLKESLYCLRGLPEGYALLDRYAHVKAGDKPTIITYLFGHPDGPKKRYKNPQEFLLHLMWLAADRDHRKANCGCMFCKGSGQLDKRPPTPPPEVLSVVQPAGSPVAVPAAAAAAAGRATARKKAAAKATAANTAPAAASPATTAATTAKPKGKAALKATPSASSTPTLQQPQMHQLPQHGAPHIPQPQQQLMRPQVMVPTHPPYPFQLLYTAPSTSERTFDLQFSMDIYRRGECVWFQASPDDRSNWSLGTILGKESAPMSPSTQAGYTIQILSSLLSKPSAHRHVTHDRIRPWLAWTAPLPQQPSLRLPEVRFETINWEQYRFSANVEVDASIVVAKEVEGTFCPLDQLPASGPNNERYYTGLWFGAEKIWVGEGVRLKPRFSHPPPPPPQGQSNQVVILRDEVLVVTCIFERLGQATPGHTNIFLQGDIYLLQPARMLPSDAALMPPPQQFLPDRMRKDAINRNNISIGSGLYSTWEIVVAGVTVPMEDVKGRWYESSVLMKDLVAGGEAAYIEALKMGGVSDLGNLLNQMGGMEGFGVGGGRGWERVGRREDAFRGGVPKGRLAHVDGWMSGQQGGGMGQQHMLQQQPQSQQILQQKLQHVQQQQQQQNLQQFMLQQQQRQQQQHHATPTPTPTPKQQQQQPTPTPQLQLQQPEPQSQQPNPDAFNSMLNLDGAEDPIVEQPHPSIQPQQQQFHHRLQQQQALPIHQSPHSSQQQQPQQQQEGGGGEVVAQQQEQGGMVFQNMDDFYLDRIHDDVSAFIDAGADSGDFFSL
ncbi:transcription-silencing protein Clr2-domain-containing protein [Tirmania nivea]|nr:transcription-silencing protein Clr2-domain-containing protein [Tirmania nivea]